MVFNHIEGNINIPGEIPWEIVAAYFIIVPLLLYLIAKKEKIIKKFTTLDYVYIGIGAAIATVWEFFIGSFLDRALAIRYIDLAFWGRMFILILVVAIVRKFGAGMLSLVIFDVLADAVHYGWAGQPLFFIYEGLTYGLFIDLIIVITKGRPFEGNKIFVALQGAIVGFLWSLPDPILWEGFLRPFIYGGIVNWDKIGFDIITSFPFTTIVGVIAAFTSLRVARAIGA
ncbi:hypothetical protein SJAV_13220 [Sulfurisphaera javensis]|uniref:Uncharacterized protein n=1 Tax=Sulfurisphaera javensis TaxID=2049879 RepID=A0AAT9GR50_9CREN